MSKGLNTYETPRKRCLLLNIKKQNIMKKDIYQIITEQVIKGLEEVASKNEMCAHKFLTKERKTFKCDDKA